METLRVIRVDEWPDPKGRPFSVFVVKAEDLAKRPVTMTTTSAWKASLCQREVEQSTMIRAE